jgi:hypothetical protein
MAGGHQDAAALPFCFQIIVQAFIADPFTDVLPVDGG